MPRAETSTSFAVHADSLPPDFAEALGCVGLVDAGGVRQLFVQGLPIADAPAKELGPDRDGGEGIGPFGEQRPEVGGGASKARGPRRRDERGCPRVVALPHR